MVGDAGDIAKRPSTHLAPLLGDSSSLFLATGFLAAGLSSAITAPLAAGYAVTEIVKLRPELKDRVFRWTWQSVIVIGVLFASLSVKPLQLILLAQIANGALRQLSQSSYCGFRTIKRYLASAQITRSRTFWGAW